MGGCGSSFRLPINRANAGTVFDTKLTAGLTWLDLNYNFTSNYGFSVFGPQAESGTSSPVGVGYSVRQCGDFNRWCLCVLLEFSYIKYRLHFKTTPAIGF